MTHKLIVHQAKEFAGAFYERKRSEKFRATWPNETDFVNTCWPRFVEPVRAVLADMLTKNYVDQATKDEIYDALIADAPANRSGDAESPIQIHPNTIAFEGDRKENFLTDETYGKQPVADASAKLLLPSARKLLNGSVAYGKHLR